jgi:hypothetical protein
LASLLGLILLFPYADKQIFGRILLGVLYSLVLVGGAYAIARNRRALMIGVGLGSLGVVWQFRGRNTYLRALAIRLWPDL